MRLFLVRYVSKDNFIVRNYNYILIRGILKMLLDFTCKHISNGRQGQTEIHGQRARSLINVNTRNKKQSV